MVQVVQVRNLSIGYKDKVVLTNVSARYESGQLICITGNNGAGKSTLLRTLAGVQKPLGGEVIIDGREIGSYSSKELAKKISIVTTSRELPHNLTGREVVEMGRMPYTGFFGHLSAEDKQIVDDSINIIGIGALAKKTIGSMSDGEVQKVMIAKSLAQQTPIILMDEPTAFLDYSSKKQLYELLRRLALEQKKLILFSSHDLPLALEYCTEEAPLKQKQ